VSVLVAVGTRIGETTASQSLFWFREWRENAVDPPAPPATRVKLPLVTVHPDMSVSKPYVRGPGAASRSATSWNVRVAGGASSDAVVTVNGIVSPQPTLFPGSGAGLDYAMVKWADAFFRAGLHMAIGLTSPAWPEEFRADRQKLFPDIDFAKVDVEHAQSQLRAHASLIDLQLRDGRAFLGGDAPGLLDIHAWTVPWFARPWMPVVNDLLAAFPRLSAWEARVAALGEGERQPIACAEAFAAARAAKPLAGSIEAGDAQGLKAGEMVDVGPEEEMRRGDVRGAVFSASSNEIAVRRSDPRCGEVVVHFPRLGYRVRRI